MARGLRPGRILHLVLLPEVRHDVVAVDAGRRKRVRDHAAMTAPPLALGADDDDVLSPPALDEVFEPVDAFGNLEEELVVVQSGIVPVWRNDNVASAHGFFRWRCFTALASGSGVSARNAALNEWFGTTSRRMLLSAAGFEPGGGIRKHELPF